MANVVIDIAAEFTGNKAFKQAETSTEKLTKNVKKLAGAVGLGFGTAQVLAFGKASVKAALEAQAQQERLANLVKVTVGATDAQVQSLNDQAAALQAIGVVNKENITQTQSQLATFNLQIDTIKTLTPAILDYVTAEKGAAASADQFKQMTNGLAQALNGNFASLTKVGFVLDEQTKKTIKSGTETERAAALVKVLDSSYKDFNKNLANTPTGQMQKLANAADDAKQIIGTGLLDALKGLGEDDSVQNLATSMQNFATETANVIRGIGKLIEKIQALDDKLPDWLKFDVGMIPIVGSWWKIASAAGTIAAVQKSSDNQHLKSLEQQYKIDKKISNISTKLTADELKKLKAKKLQQAIDKANLALGKGEGVFDIEKIQIAAALTNQAQLLGKATEASQVLQIANDTARLNVKQSILALEDAIASKDEASIVAATKKLSADLAILATLGGQKNQVQAIESILKSLVPKDLINQKNLDQALLSIKQMLDELAKFKWPPMPNYGGGFGPILGGGGPTGGGGTGGGGTGGGGTGTGGTGTGGAGTGGAGTGGAGTGTGTGTGGAGTGAILGGDKPIIPKETTDQINKAVAELGGTVSVIGENGIEFLKLIDGAAKVFQIVEDSGAFNALVNSFASGTINSFNAGTFRAAEGGSLFNSGAVGSRDRNFNITVNTGVGDPEAIARAIEDAIRQANQRGTTSLSIA